MGNSVFSVFDRIGAAGRILVAGIGVATVAAVFYLVSSAGPSAYVAAFTNLTPKQAGQVQAALAGAKIPTKLDAAGTEVLVPGASVDAAKVAVDTAGIATNGAPTSCDPLKIGLGATDFQQSACAEEQQQATLATQIEQIGGVQSATVNLAIPQSSIFLGDQAQPSASVMVDLGGGQLSDSSVTGIQRLVSGAVIGLTAESVVVTDERGDLLTTDTGSGAGGISTARLATQFAYSNRLQSEAQTMVDDMLGPGKAVVKINAILNLDQQTIDSVTYGKATVPVSKTSEKEKLKSTGGGSSGGVAGATGTPGYAAGTGTATTNYTHSTGNTTNGVDQTNSSLTKAAGDATHMFVAIAFANPGPKQPASGSGTVPGATSMTPDQSAAASAVQALLGISKSDLTSGKDTFQTSVTTQPLAVSAATFVPASAKGGGGGGPIGMVTGYLKPALAGLGTLMMLFLVRRSLKKRQNLLGSSEARWMPALAAPPIPIDEIELPSGPSQRELEAASKKALQSRIEEVAQARPADVAAQLRGWLAEER